MSMRATLDREIEVLLVQLDSLLHREILRLRARYQLSLDEFRGLYVSDEQVDALVEAAAPHGKTDEEDECAFERWHSLCTQAAAGKSRIGQLATRCHLSERDVGLLIVAIAPALDPKYEALYAYLNNDITRKLPTLDLAVRLLARNCEEGTALRAAAAADNRLVASRLLRAQAARDVAAGGAQQQLLCAHAALPNYLCGLPFIDDQIVGMMMTREPKTMAWAGACNEIRDVAHQIQRSIEPGPLRLNVVQTKSSLSVAAFVHAVCSELGFKLNIVDLRRVGRDSWYDILSRAVLVSQVEHCALLVDGADVATETEGKAGSEAVALRALLQARNIPVFVSAASSASLSGVLAPQEKVHIEVAELSAAARRLVWQEALTGWHLETDNRDIDDLAARFRLDVDSVAGAVQRLADCCTIDGRDRVQRDELFAAARAQSDALLAHLAQRVPQHYVFDDLVLPPATRQRVRAVTEAVVARDCVLDKWGLGRALGTRGLRILFAGPSGTGKTMSAGVIARELGLDVYRIDLSQVVSKYIGETERNLERIFRAAAGANAILFFDEADALFGKRSEVKDAHDRYANIEVAYLLQRIEDFDGIVILASNISRNIDPAFARRMTFVVEFPLPGPAERQKLWRRIFPASAPVADNVDYEFLARSFELSGGDIRNVALDAAFVAARDDQSIGMRHIVQALARELVKQGRSPSATEFRQHYALLDAV